MKTLIKNALLLDVAHDYEAADILVDGEKIAAVGPHLPPEGADVIDLGGQTVMPAFLDAHVHTKPASGPFADEDEILSAFVYNGVSAVKDLGILDDIPLEGYIQWLSQQDKPGKVRIATAGRYIDVDGGYGMGPFPGVKWGIEIVTPQEAVDAVLYQFRTGVNGIKIGINDGVMSPIKGQLSPEHIKAITSTAKTLGIWSTAHVYTVADLRTLIANGIGEAAHTPHDAVIDDVTIAAMVDNGIPMTTTIGNWAKNGPLPDHFPPSFASAQQFLDVMLIQKEITLKNLQKFYQAGGTISIGTDFMRSSTPYKDATIPVGELRQLRQDVGMTMTDAIRAGTVNAAASCGFTDEGAIRPGNRANLIAFRGSLADDFSQLLNLTFVMNRGAIIRRQ